MRGRRAELLVADPPSYVNSPFIVIGLSDLSLRKQPLAIQVIKPQVAVKSALHGVDIRSSLHDSECKIAKMLWLHVSIHGIRAYMSNSPW